jgi:hypothetical protein
LMFCTVRLVMRFVRLITCCVRSVGASTFSVFVKVSVGMVCVVLCMMELNGRLVVMMV